MPIFRRRLAEWLIFIPMSCCGRSRSGEAGARVPAFFERYLKAGIAPLQNIAYSCSPYLHHLHSNLQYEISRNNSDIRYIWLFSAIAADLIIAVINYINLATAGVPSGSKK